MNIEEIMAEIKYIMESYNLTFEQALELFKVQIDSKNLKDLNEKLEKINIEIASLSEKLGEVVTEISYTNSK